MPFLVVWFVLFGKTTKLYLFIGCWRVLAIHEVGFLPNYIALCIFLCFILFEVTYAHQQKVVLHLVQWKIVHCITLSSVKKSREKWLLSSRAWDRSWPTGFCHSSEQKSKYSIPLVFRVRWKWQLPLWPIILVQEWPRPPGKPSRALSRQLACPSFCTCNPWCRSSTAFATPWTRSCQPGSENEINHGMKTFRLWIAMSNLQK